MPNGVALRAMRRRVLSICGGALVVTAVVALSIGSAAATRTGARHSPDQFSSAARAAGSKRLSGFPHVLRPAPLGGCSVSGGECVRGCAIPVVAPARARRGLPRSCDGAAPGKPCLLPIAGTSEPPGRSTLAGPCASTGTPGLRVLDPR
jgi:hypothetical protein